MNLKNRLLKNASALITVALILSVPTMSLGWGAGGHMMTANIAFGKLNPHATAEVEKLLAIPVKVTLPNGTKPKLSPEDQKKLDSYTADSSDFVNAAHWADDLKGIATFNPFKELHFKDIFFSEDGSTLPHEATSNIVTALKRDVEILKHSHDDNARAQALRFLIHFVGDIHQPLHCSSRVVNNKSDGGGNLTKLASGQSLHSYWDGGLGTFLKEGPPPTFKVPPPTLAQIDAAAKKIAAAYPDTAPGLNLNDPTNFDSWVEESSQLAKTFAYKGITNGTSPSDDYRKDGIRVAEQRVAWGGYRLAALLNSIWP